MEADRDLNRADLGLFTSYCPDGPTAAELILSSNSAIKCFYDLDTPVTLTVLRTGDSVDYLPKDSLGAFDLVLAWTMLQKW